MDNPFILDFGIKPTQYISRISQTKEIISSFDTENPSKHIYMITGVRGSGKTVMLSSIADSMENKPEWYTVELNPSRDLLESLAAKIYSFPEMKKLFLKAKLDFSAFGLGVSIENGFEIADIEVAIEKMLSEMSKNNKRLFISIDEVEKNDGIKVFSHTFQMLLRKGFPIFLLMTGLYENIYELQNDKSLTFLYRAPKILLEPLNTIAVANSYEKIFHLSEEASMRMAKLTRGYPFAYQVLGYLFWESQEKELDAVMPEYDQYLSEYVYEKIWSELSELDRKVMTELSHHEGRTRTKELRESLGMDSSLFSVYRDRLFRKGILNTSDYGYVSITLPRFAEYAKKQSMI